MNTLLSLKIDKDVKASVQGVEECQPKLEKLIEEAQAELKTGKVSKKFNNAEDFLAGLKK